MPANFDQTVGFHLPGDLLDRIDDEVIRRMQDGAAPQGGEGAANRSAVVRDALNDYLDRQELVA